MPIGSNNINNNTAYSNETIIFSDKDKSIRGVAFYNCKITEMYGLFNYCTFKNCEFINVDFYATFGRDNYISKCKFINIRCNPVNILHFFDWANTITKSALTKELMHYDAINHPTPSKFNKWSKTLKCPYAHMGYDRALKFAQSARAWNSSILKKKAPSALSLLRKLMIANGSKLSFLGDKRK